MSRNLENTDEGNFFSWLHPCAHASLARLCRRLELTREGFLIDEHHVRENYGMH